jgi:hypothetical protein
MGLARPLGAGALTKGNSGHGACAENGELDELAGADVPPAAP